MRAKPGELSWLHMKEMLTTKLNSRQNLGAFNCNGMVILNIWFICVIFYIYVSPKKCICQKISTCMQDGQTIAFGGPNFYKGQV